MFHVADFVTIALLVGLEGLLSADNAMVLAVIVLGLPKPQQRKALRYGLGGAFAFRTAATLLAVYLILIGFVKLIGCAYLLYLSYGHFFGGATADERRAVPAAKPWLGLNAFWATVVKVELTDIVFAIDSILVGVAMSKKVWVVLAGGLLGIVMMRLVIGRLLTIIERYPALVDGAFVIIAWVGLELLLTYLFDAGYVHFAVPRWLSLGLIVVIFAAAFLYARREERLAARARGARGDGAVDRRGGALLKLLRPRTIWDWIAVTLVVAFVTAGAVSVWWLSKYAVAVHRLTRGVGDTVFYGADGQPWFRLDEQRHDVALADISPLLQHAVVAVEDRRFYYHPGIDPIGLVRAAVRDVQSHGRVEGGSTLTQQLARTLFLSNVRTYGRKVKEAGLALLMEAQLTKPQILELYLNRVYLSAGVYGVETMSEYLFRKPAKHLTLPEAAMIAGLIRAPSTLSPWSNYEGALERSHLVLTAMREQKFITPAEEQAARRVQPRIQPYRQPYDPRGAWAKEYLRQEFRTQFGGDHPPDWQVKTSFIPSVQDAAERAVAAGIQRLHRPGLEAALVAIDPSTGDLLALVGGSNYLASTFNRATRSRRQPGSAFKPFVYAAALQHGYSPVSVLEHLGAVSAPGDPEWHPRSVSHASADAMDPDAMTLREALLESNNAAAASLQQRVGSGVVLRLAGEAGLKNLPDVASLALGTGVVTPIDLVTAYTMFPGGGQVAHPRGIVSVFDAGGSEVLDKPVDRERVLSDAVAFQMVSMLRDVVERGTGTPARTLGVRGAIGGKTGTTDEYHDAWFVGFSSSVVAGVWVGFDQPAPIGRDAYGARVALPIWADFMKRTARTLPANDFEIPHDVRGEELCSVSYVRPVDGCPIYTEYFKAGDVIPTRLCPIHQGSLKQRATRLVEGLFRSLGDRIAGLFHRR